jgi:hypothetical protein
LWSGWINEWYEDGFDPEFFDKGEVNKLLQSKNYGVWEL